MVEGYPPGLGGWSVGGVFKEAGRLQVKYVGLLAPFVLAFVLPASLLQLLEVVGVAWWAAGPNPFLPPGPHPGSVFAPSPLPPPPPPGRVLLVALLVGVVMWLLGSLAVASVCEVVKYVYSDREEDPSVISSIFQSLPGAIWRLLVTSICVALFVALTAFLVALPFSLLSLLIGLFHKHWTIIPSLQHLSVYVAVTILGFLFLLSQEVAVLEPDHYGLTALKRSAKLVEEKLLTALALFALSILVGGLLSTGSNWVAAKLATNKLPPWTVYILGVVLVLLYLVFFLYVLLVTVVLYFSSKVKYDGEEGSLPVDNPYTVVQSEE